MHLPDVERLVAELLATGEMNADTVADLERILAEAQAGQSHPDDLDYLQALHARILSPDRTAPESDEIIEESTADLRREIDRLQAELQQARQTIASLEARLAPEA